MRKNGWMVSQNRGKFVSIFFFFFVVTIILFILSQSPLGENINGFFDKVLRPMQQTTYSLYGGGKEGMGTSELERLRSENRALQIALAKQQELEREIAALQAQFTTTTVLPQKLLPAQIVGIKSFIPGFSLPSEVILDRGERDGVIIGQVVMSQEIVVGKVVRVSPHASLVELSTKEGFSVTAKTSKTNAAGILRGQGSSLMILDNILLSDKLEEGDIVLSKGSVNEKGFGIPPDLTLGKIISINKKSSELFQSAEVAPLFDITKLTTVFILQQST